MTVQVKICGLTRPEDAAAVVAAEVDFAGLVFHPASSRHLRPQQAVAIADRLRGKVRIVALLVDPSDDSLLQSMTVIPDLIQLHGSEPPRRVAEVRARFGRPVVKALAVAEPSDLERLASYEAVSDMLLFDSKPAAGESGGRGRAFDWQLLRGRTIRKPWLLAGGLDARNVAHAVRRAGAPGVDVSSGVESAPGIKDPGAIREFVRAARGTDSEPEDRL